MANQQKTYTASDNFNFADWNAEFANVYSAINGGGSTTVAANSITEANMANDANVAVYFGELLKDGAVTTTTGFAYLSDTGLDVTITAGDAYVYQTSSTPDKLLRVTHANNETYTVLDNTTNYLDLGADGVMDVTQASSAATDHMRILKVVAASAAISSTTDEADRDFLGDTIGDFNPKNVDWSCTAATTVIVAAGTRFRDTTNALSFQFATAQTIDITASGVNGVDQSSEAGNTWYAVVGIGDSSGVNATKGMFVTAANYPGSITMPSGYDLYKRIGWIRNDGSSNLTQGHYSGDTFMYEEGGAALSGGTSTTFAGVSMTAFIPPTQRFVYLHFDATWGGTGILHIRETGSSATTGIPVAGSATGSLNNTAMALSSTSQSIDYKAGSGINGLDITVAGYIDNTEKES